MTEALEPSPGDYVVHYSVDNGVHRLLLVRVQSDAGEVLLLTTFASLSGAQARFEEEARARAGRDGVRAFRRDRDGTHVPLR